MPSASTIALSDVCRGYEALRPPNRMSVSAGAAANLIIRQPGAAGGPWNAVETPYMVEPMNTLASRQHEAVVFVGPARIGKALDVETPIPTPTGFVRMGDLRAGDLVFGDDGKPTKVLVAHPVSENRNCYEIVFSDDTSLIADEEHLWGVERFNKQNEPDRWVTETVTTKQMLERGIEVDGPKSLPRWRFRVVNQRPVEFDNSAKLVIDPYLLGLWLGNGSSESAQFTCHRDDAQHYVNQLVSCGHTAEATFPSHKPNTAYVLADKAHVGSRKSKFRRSLKALGVLGSKHIPDAYKFSSVSDRIALLQGLMDSDGSSCGNDKSLTFASSNNRLKDDVAFLIRSLGLRVNPRLRQVKWRVGEETRKGTTWVFRFTTPGSLCPFRLKRKVDTWASSEEKLYRSVVAIRQVESRPVRCIGVANKSKLFLAGYGLVPTHNTASLLLGWMTHNVVNDPGDMLFVHLNKDKAREFSKTDVDRAIRHSPNVAAMRSPRAIDSNTFDTMFRHGMWVRIVWPTVSNVSGSTYRYVAITDIDRIENAENVDGEGPLFDLAKKRTTTFMSRGMTLVESSPGYPITDPAHVPATPHEAPPTRGILSIYNRSDRNRQYWQCPDCREHFQAAPGLELFSLMPPESALLEEVRTMNIGSFARHHAKVVCPHCASIIEPSMKQELNRTGLWLPDGVQITADREIIGTPLQSTIKGYWLGGVAAAYQSWQSMIEQHLYGLREYALTGSEEKLKQTTNTDQGAPYLPRHLAEAKGSNKSPRERAERGMLRYFVPAQARLLTASVDVQGGQNARFEVQIHATGPDDEKWLVDRFPIKDSMREGMEGLGSFAPIDPSTYPEDWDVLTEKVLRATWRTPVEGLEMQVAAMIVDTGGEDGATEMAYAYYRRMRAQRMHKRIVLYKGGSKKGAPILRETLVGKIGHKGKDDLPLLLCNTNLLSDAVDAGLRRQSPGAGYYHFPEPKHPTKNPDGWLPEAFFDELTAEVRNADGTWTKLRKRNESFDLLRMDYALKLHLGVYKIRDWNVVPQWLAPLEKNSFVVAVETRRALQQNTPIPQVQPEVRIVRKPQRRRRATAPA